MVSSPFTKIRISNDENVVMVVDFRLGRLENIAPVHKSKLRKRVDFYFGPGGPQEARVASGGCFLVVFW